MCGIAGYNVTPEFREKHIADYEVQLKILEAAWLYNQHRGIHAAGVMGLTDDNKIAVSKRAGRGDLFMKDIRKNINGKDNPTPTRVMGAHTRAATQGDPSDNANNHPVYYNGIWCTHNGTIRNDEKVRTLYCSKKQQKNLPEVDSVAIPIVLSICDGPFDEELGDMLYSELTGGYAIHAMWEAHPGVSLIARGSMSPLVIAWNEEHGIFYGSEVESVWHMIWAAGALDYDWSWREVDAFTGLIFKDGLLVKPFYFGKAWHSSPQSMTPIHRILPAEGEREMEIVYTADKYTSFANEVERSLMESDGEQLSLLYTRDGGIMPDEKHKEWAFPLQNKGGMPENHTLAPFSEADSVVYNENNDDYHIWFGNVELVVTKYRTVRDVYNHDLPFTWEQRWYEDEEEPEEKATPNLTLKQLVTKHTTPASARPTEVEPSRYEQEMARMKAEEERKKLQPAVPAGNVVKNAVYNPQATAEMEKRAEGKGFLPPDPIVTWENLQSTVTFHELGYAGFVFSRDLKCAAHNDVPYYQHPDPWECPLARTWAAYTLSLTNDLEVTAAMITNAYLSYSDYGVTCLSDCNWRVTQYGTVETTSGLYFNINLAEQCRQCGAVRTVNKLPAWLNEMLKIKQVTYAS